MYESSFIGVGTDKKVGRLKARRAESEAEGRERGGVLGRGQLAPSPPARGSGGAL